MKALDKETAIARMNTFGRNGTPFLFVIDYMQEHSYVEPLDGTGNSHRPLPPTIAVLSIP